MYNYTIPDAGVNVKGPPPENIDGISLEIGNSLAGDMITFSSGAKFKIFEAIISSNSIFVMDHLIFP